MTLQAIVEQCVTGLGYELVDVEHGPGGLLRVYIDVVSSSAPAPSSEHPVSPEGVRIEDCERVSHQLTHLLTVENIDYARLEVSSPGLDRPLRKAADFERFAGSEAAIRLRMPFEGRRNFEGVLTVEGDGRFGIEFDHCPPPASGVVRGRKVGGRLVRKAPVAADRAGAGKGPAAGDAHPRKLVFALEEIDRARLVPKVKF
jgi:ribosome maturation factor RimP